jgi:hypothetical protein
LLEWCRPVAKIVLTSFLEQSNFEQLIMSQICLPFSSFNGFDALSKLLLVSSAFPTGFFREKKNQFAFLYEKRKVVKERFSFSKQFELLFPLISLFTIIENYRGAKTNLKLSF